MGMLRALDHTVRHLVAPNRKPSVAYAVWGITLAKYGLVGIGFHYLFQSAWIRPGWLAAGIGLPQAAMVARAACIVLAGAVCAMKAQGR